MVGRAAWVWGCMQGRNERFCFLLACIYVRVWSCLLLYPSHIFNFGLSCFPFAGAHAQQRVRAVVFVHDPCAVFAFLIVAFAPMDRKGISKSAKPYRRTPHK